MRSERDLARTMRTAAGQAGNHDLAQGVARRRRARRTRQRVRALLAAAAVVALAGGTAVVVSGEARRAGPAVTVTPSAPPRIERAAEPWRHAVPEEELLPAAPRSGAPATSPGTASPPPITR
ncbi:hypothetical protein [Nonomuraea sp. NPDC050643]|uniref:hypothetical protein n=1 Tax=Nonomuraea sp. NPDC050643 TaxID=3155660 RepID=UPI0033CC0847